MIKRSLVLAGGLLALTAATQVTAAKPSVASPMIAHARKLIAARLIDPASLQVRKTRIVRQTVQGKLLTVACGEYNSKNRLGGYIGFQTFAYEPTVLHGVASFDGETFGFYGEDGSSEEDNPSFFDESTARIVAVCLGLSQ